MVCGTELLPQLDESRHQGISTLEPKVHRVAAFVDQYENAFTDGALSSKVKRLIALAMTIAQNSDENISHHMGEALRSGASGDEIREAVTVAVLTQALASVGQFEAKEMMSSKH